MATIRTRSYFTGLFITGYQPNQTTYADLFLSIAMKKESTDRARVTTGSSDLSSEQGLVVLATDAQVKANTAQLTDRSIVVQPHQVPTTQSDVDQTIGTFTGQPITVTIDGAITTRNNYKLSLTPSFATWLSTLGSGGDKFKATSTSTVTIGTGSKTFAIGTGYAYDGSIPTRVRAYSSASGAAYYMDGTVTGYSAGNLTINVDTAGNIGTPLNSWIIDLSSRTFDIFKTTSTTSMNATPGPIIMTVASGLSYTVGQAVYIYSASDPTAYMIGYVSSYSGTSLHAGIYSYGNTAVTKADWVINVSAYMPTDVSTTTFDSVTVNGGSVQPTKASSTTYTVKDSLVCASGVITLTGGTGPFDSIYLTPNVLPIVGDGIMYGVAIMDSDNTTQLLVTTDPANARLIISSLNPATGAIPSGSPTKIYFSIIYRGTSSGILF